MALAALLVLVICLGSLVPFAWAAPINNIQSHAPCLVDGDCIAAQQCYWEPGKESLTGQCRFGLRDFPGEVLVRNHRDRRQLPNDGGPPAFVAGKQAGQNPGPVQNQHRMQTVQHRMQTVSSPGRLDEMFNKSTIEGWMNRTHTTMLPLAPPPGNVAGSAPFVINEDNTRDTLEFNNANDINFIHVPPTHGYLSELGDESGIKEAWRPETGARAALQAMFIGETRHDSHVGNGMEDDVDFIDEVVHDPLELAAAAEEAAIRSGDDIPHRESKKQQYPTSSRESPAGAGGGNPAAYGRPNNYRVEHHSF